MVVDNAEIADDRPAGGLGGAAVVVRANRSNTTSEAISSLRHAREGTLKITDVDLRTWFGSVRVLYLEWLSMQPRVHAYVQSTANRTRAHATWYVSQPAPYADSELLCKSVNMAYYRYWKVVYPGRTRIGVSKLYIES